MILLRSRKIDSLTGFFTVVGLTSLLAGGIFNSFKVPAESKSHGIFQTRIILDSRSSNRDVVKNFSLDQYLDDVDRRIKRAWFKPDRYKKSEVVVLFDVKSNGVMDNLRLVKNSGVAPADLACLKAVKLAAPFKAIPWGGPHYITVKYIFAYPAWRH